MVSYKDLVIKAIIALADRTGSSQPAIEKYILANAGGINYERFRLRLTIKKGLEAGWLKRNHQHANSYMLTDAGKKKAAAKKPAAKKPAAAKKTAAKKSTTKKTAAKKTTKKSTAGKKKAATKKPAAKKAKKPAAKKSTPKKAAAKK